MVYAADLLIRDISKTLVLFLLAIPFGIASYILVFAVAYGFLGRVAFGFHIESFPCLINGLVYYLGSVYFSIYVYVPVIVKIIIFVICGILLCLYAPAETKQRPISPRQKKELKPKIMSRFVLLFATSIVLLLMSNQTYSTLVLCSVVLRTVNVLPFLNYKKPEISKEVKK